MVGIERQLDTITFISPRVAPGRPLGAMAPTRTKAAAAWPASPIAFQRLSPDASILKILYVVRRTTMTSDYYSRGRRGKKIVLFLFND